MNEIQRQQYLDALGIESYMPRWILPQAPAPFSCEPVLPQVVSEQATQAASSEPANQPTPAVNPVADVAAQPVSPVSPAATPIASESQSSAGSSAASALAELSGENVEAKAKSGQPTSAKSILASLSGEQRPDPQFALTLWRVSDELMVIDSRHAELALPTEPLLNNILVALGLPRQPLPKADILRWPMFENQYEAQGQDVARETLQAMLEGMLESRPCKYLLLMGAEACHFILNAEQLGEGFEPGVSLKAFCGKSFALNHLSATAIVVPSLSDMLQNPEQKRDTWRAIQPLRQS